MLKRQHRMMMLSLVFMRPMTAGTSLSEAALGRPSLLQAAVCYPSLSEAAVVITSLSEAGTSTEHRHASSRRPAPAPSTSIPSTSTSTRHPPGAQHPAPCLHHTHSQRPARRPASTTRTPAHSAGAGARCLYHAHCQHPAPALSHSQQHQQPVSTSNLSPPRAQPAHSTSTNTGTRHPAPAPAPATCLHHMQSQLTAPAPPPAPSTSNLSRKRARATQCYLKQEPHSFAIWGKKHVETKKLHSSLIFRNVLVKHGYSQKSRGKVHGQE